MFQAGLNNFFYLYLWFSIKESKLKHGRFVESSGDKRTNKHTQSRKKKNIKEYKDH